MPIQELVDLINENQSQGMVICEIGCWQGESTIGYLPCVRNNNGKIILVDWFQGNIGAGEGPHQFNQDNAQFVKERLCFNIKDYLDIVQIIEGKSQEVYNQIPDGYLDICFLDASHRYKDFSADLKNFLPKVKKGGILSGHDFEKDFTSGSFSEEELDMDWIPNKSAHGGVIQGVFDMFGDNFEVRCYTGNRHGVWWTKI